MDDGSDPGGPFVVHGRYDEYTLSLARQRFQRRFVSHSGIANALVARLLSDELILWCEVCSRYGVHA